MRKIYIFLILLPGSIIALKAQTENKGDFEIGGSTRAGISLDFESDIVNASFHPFVGYYLTNNLVLGVGILLNHTGNDFQKVTDYSVAPFLKYYVLEKEHLKPYIRIQAGIGQYISQYNYSSLYSSRKRTSTTYSLNTGVGISYWVNPSIALTTELNYGYHEIKNLPTEDNSLNLNFGLQFKLGK